MLALHEMPSLNKISLHQHVFTRLKSTTGLNRPNSPEIHEIAQDMLSVAIAVLRLPRLKEGADSFSYKRMWVELLDGNEYVPLSPLPPLSQLCT